MRMYNKLRYRRGTARRAMSVEILSTVETSCTTNQQQLAVMELEGYSWSTCSKQPRLIDRRIGVVYKLDRRRVLLTCRGEIFLVRTEFGAKFQTEVPYFGDTQISLQHSVG